MDGLTRAAKALLVALACMTAMPMAHAGAAELPAGMVRSPGARPASNAKASAVQFRTPSAILGVRGTEFIIDAGNGAGD